jgi:hypothetical protein
LGDGYTKFSAGFVAVKILECVNVAHDVAPQRGELLVAGCGLRDEEMKRCVVLDPSSTLNLQQSACNLD